MCRGPLGSDHGHAWSRVTRPEDHDVVAIVMDGGTFESWRESGEIDIEDFGSWFEQIAGSISPDDHWTHGFLTARDASAVVSGGEATVGEHRSPRPPPSLPCRGCRWGNQAEDSSGRWPAAQLTKRGIDMEQSFRHHVARRLFIPSGGFRLVPRAPGFHRDGLEAITQRAWSDWMPPRAVRLDLVVDASGEPRLDVFDSRVRDSLPRRSQRERRTPLGWVWTSGLPGHRRNHSANRRRTHRVSYVLSEGIRAGDRVGRPRVLGH